MSRKLDIRNKMAELHKEYAAMATELKSIEETDNKATLRERYKDYMFKVFVDQALDSEPTFEDVTDEDREHGRDSEKTGVVFSDGFRTGAYLMLKSKEEYPRIKLLYDRLSALKTLEDKNTKDKEKYIKIILGEEE